ncbi:alpha/beta fold hydrolase [Allosaccharopolyspora coralli]|uniref:Alpha/beta fold hydrolase n=1 Tax=Allosaccharopolyspora coralli TaxID=2665642 RepID=A0A5Q3Q7E6_9PSEU|nr:alpha/beta fold hydrolase [Allosaccharopolyspora coralli]QGK70538.1 alpha/beta fold hydrolase [Allosaccharopolyspora coralli]
MSERHTSARARDGVELAVQEHGDPQRPTVVCVHGYPDDHELWNGVVGRLAERFHVVTYDVRGAGQSGHPTQREAYRLEQLQDDFAVILDRVSPDAPVHLLAHDWGSIQSWYFVSNDPTRQRVRTFTSISGPSLAHVPEFFRRRRSTSPRALAELATQSASSAYIALFRAPVVPEWLARRGVIGWMLDRHDRRARDAAPVPRAVDDLVSGLELYRANIGGRAVAHGAREVTIPVQVVAPTNDAFVGVPLQTDIGAWVRDLHVEHVAGSHWLPRTQPELVADFAMRHVDRAN